MIIINFFFDAEQILIAHKIFAVILIEEIYKMLGTKDLHENSEFTN